jgi:hypothetical protein
MRPCGLGCAIRKKASAIVAASVGSGSLPSQRDAWVRETSALARVFIEHGMVGMAERMARGPAPIQLKYKDRRSWQEFSRPSASAFAAGNVEYDAALPGLAAIIA